MFLNTGSGGKYKKNIRWSFWIIMTFGMCIHETVERICKFYWNRTDIICVRGIEEMWEIKFHTKQVHGTI